VDLADGCVSSSWDGWAYLAAVLNCQNYCECISYEFAFRGRAQKVEGAAEVACLKRFGTLRPSVPHKHPKFGLVSARQECQERYLAETKIVACPLLAHRTKE